MRSGAWIGVGMIFKMIRNDLTKNKIITLAATVFIAAAALLVSLAALLAIDLAGSGGCLNGAGTDASFYADAHRRFQP